MANTPTLATLRRTLATRLAAISDSPDLEARRLLEIFTGLNGSRLIIEADRPLEPETIERVEAAVARRLTGEPLAYIVGRIGFHDIELEVTPAVLVPRPDTETLVEAALARLPADTALRVADLGTGSGAIALALAHARPRWRLVATDADPNALAVARGNAERLALTTVSFAHGCWLEPLAGERFDAIVSNPPYIDADDSHLDAPALRHEPYHALVADTGGLGDIQRIATAATNHLEPGAPLLVEHGYTQGPAVRRLFAAAGLTRIETEADLGGHPRVTIGYR
ncbi:peptide chain release factor N(5)-glutamine methyltransferase [Salinisphaera hydrothermalis]|uniref:peptide chain release factor N(5)-glutamine methyltransferase n=1 Tax=Salinisphaera hydrothermalis TaxID=563188 RepID=UPI00334282BE